MQNYDSDNSRNSMRAVSNNIKNGGPIPGPVGSNQSQGKGQIPGMVSVPFPNNADKPVGGTKSGGNVPGFSGGIIDGKV